MAKSDAVTFTFALVLDGFHEPTGEIEDGLFEAGCDDGMVAFRGRTPVLEFDRQAPSLEQAITSAIADVDRAGLGITVLRVEPDDLVNAAEIARRVDKSREAVRLWSEGARGGGDFPPPVAFLERSVLWSWQEVAFWLSRRHLVDTVVVEAARVVAAINAFLETQRAAPMRSSIERVGRLLRRSAMIARLREVGAGGVDRP